MIQDTLTILAPSAHEKHLELVCLVYRDKPTHLVGDPQRLRQVLTNLVSNAIKFTHSGTIAVRAMVRGRDRRPRPAAHQRPGHRGRPHRRRPADAVPGLSPRPTTP